MQQTIQIWVEDQPSVLRRIAGIITSKGANIRTLTVTPDPDQREQRGLCLALRRNPVCGCAS